jgi:hypothetical protein
MAQVTEVLAGRYELLDVLGRGGMGVVYRARDQRLDRVVAIKVLPLDSAQDPTSVARFEREALAAAALTHRNIVAVFDSGRDDGTRFIVMERVVGRSLAQLISERGSLAVDEAVGICVQVASALEAAHRAGIVHRDIKPANLMLDEHGTVKVLDFGIARLAGSASLTQAATVLGSAAYLAPELSRGSRADARSDVYALGCVLYELLTGRPPFIGEQPAAILSQHISSQPHRPDRLKPAIPPRLADLMLTMLAKDPGKRPQRAGELLALLPATLVDEELTAPTMVMATPASTARGVRRVGVVAAMALVALTIAVLALTAGSGSGGGQGAARAATHRTSETRLSRRRTTASSTPSSSVTTPVATPKPAPAPPKHHGLHPAPGPGDHPGPGDGPPGHDPGGPHGDAARGLPPGQAEKLGDDHQNQHAGAHPSGFHPSPMRTYVRAMGTADS